MRIEHVAAPESVRAQIPLPASRPLKGPPPIDWLTLVTWTLSEFVPSGSFHASEDPSAKTVPSWQAGARPGQPGPVLENFQTADFVRSLDHHKRFSEIFAGNE